MKLKIRRKDGMIMEDDLLNVIMNEWQTLDLLFADNKEARQYSLSALGMLLDQLGYKRVETDLIESN